MSIEVDPQHPALAADPQPSIAPPPDDAPEPPVSAPPPLLGRYRLQAELDAVAARRLSRRRNSARTSDARTRQQRAPDAAAPAQGDDNERLHEMFQSEGWEAMKEWLQKREAGWLVQLRNPVSTLEQLRVAQGALFEIQVILQEEGRVASLVNKEPEPLPPDVTAFPADLSEVQQGRAP